MPVTHDGGVEEVEGVPPQIVATPGMPERKAVARRQARVRAMLHTLPKDAQAAILDDLEGTHKYRRDAARQDRADMQDPAAVARRGFVRQLSQ